MRTSYIGDTLTRDGYHLSYISASQGTGGFLGRYTASITWAAYILGADVSKFEWYPSTNQSIGEALPAVKEAVANALEKPFEVTKSSYPGEVIEPQPNEELTEEDKAFLKDQGLNPDDYEVLSLGLTLHSYYNSSGNNKTLNTTSNSTASNLIYFISTTKFDKQALPVGSIIYVKEGYQYRPEGWEYSSSRPTNVTTSVVKVDSAWWGTYTMRAFNIAYVGNETRVTENDMDAFRIYVPKNPVEEEPNDEPKVTVTKEDLADTSKYTKVELEFTIGAYYYSTAYASTLQSSSNSSATNLPYFAATQIFKKEELPVGTVIVVDKGYQYRPEAWTSLTSKTPNRPGNVTEEIVVVDEAWWGDFNYRAFNLSYIGSATNIKADDTVHLNIYIPVTK